LSITILCLILAFGLAAAVAQTTKSGEVEDAFIIETKDMKPKDLKPGVGFTHLKHSVDYKITCVECHHDYKDGKNVWKEGDEVKLCVECHDMKKRGPAKKQYKLKNAMHKNCQTCHKELAKDKKPTGPTKKCAECHTGKLPG
jgi:hypothetical protein